ncbi:MAG: SEC-C metal-binding domain-containing protein [Elusimicrobia bacterium]|nr:SEC-C metal-binding domain-containing protein [Elusimicrobiota bacterium]
MKKITTQDLINSASAMKKDGAAREHMMLFAGEQPELLEYILELSEDDEDDELSDMDRTFLETISLHLWHALKAGGFAPPPAQRQAVYALEKHNLESLENNFSKEKKDGDFIENLLASRETHPQPELARATLLLVLSPDEGPNKLNPGNVLVPVMTIIDSLCGVKPPAAALAEFADLPPRRWEGIQDLRLVEQSSDHMQRLTDGKDFANIDEMNAFLNEKCIGRLITAPPSSKLEEAQDLIYKAMGYQDFRVRERLARLALELSPDCADAWNLLAEEAAETDEEALEFYRRGIKAGARALGAALQADHGRLWGHVKARPYMRARKGEALMLEELGRFEEAERAFYELLELNKSDNQGVRYLLLAFHAHKLEFAKMDALINNGRYPDDCAAEWVYAKALAAYALGKQGASLCLQQALAVNPHVPGYLLTGKKPPLQHPDSVTVGGEDEAWMCAQTFRKAWENTPGALPWLKTGEAALAGPKTGRNEHCPCGSGKKYKKCCGR